jgi:hypothetical protein
VRNVTWITDDDQAAGAGVDDIVETLAQRPTGSDYIQGPEKPGILSFR